MRNGFYVLVIAFLVSVGFYYHSQGVLFIPWLSPPKTVPTPQVRVFYSGNVKVEILKPGFGPTVKNGNTVSLNYAAWLYDGQKAANSFDGAKAMVVTLGDGEVVPGVERGVLGMQVGEKRRLTVPPELGYGSAGNPKLHVPGETTLIYEVTILGVQ